MHMAHKMRMGDFVDHWLQSFAAAPTQQPQQSIRAPDSLPFRWSLHHYNQQQQQQRVKNQAATLLQSSSQQLLQEAQGDSSRTIASRSARSTANALNPGNVLPTMFSSIDSTLRNVAKLVDRAVHAGGSGQCHSIESVELHIEILQQQQ
jgi:hypothetical protein